MADNNFKPVLLLLGVASEADSRRAQQKGAAFSISSFWVEYGSNFS